MRSTTENQWRDPKWWNENAGSASYYCPVNAQFYDSKLHPCCIPRPTPWKGPKDGLPPVGTEFELSYNEDCWVQRVMLFNDGVTCLMAHKKYPANRWHYKCDDPDIRCRPIQSELDKLLNYAHNLVDKKLINSNASADGSFALEKVIEVLFDAGMLVDPERKPMSREKAIYNIQRLVPDLDTAQAMAIADMLGHED